MALHSLKLVSKATQLVVMQGSFKLGYLKTQPSASTLACDGGLRDFKCGDSTQLEAVPEDTRRGVRLGHSSTGMRARPYVHEKTPLEIDTLYITASINGKARSCVPVLVANSSPRKTPRCASGTMTGKPRTRGAPRAMSHAHGLTARRLLSNTGVSQTQMAMVCPIHRLTRARSNPRNTIPWTTTSIGPSRSLFTHHRSQAHQAHVRGRLHHPRR
jgi:hypothetical protein